MKLNREAFFAYARRSPFGGRLTQSQVSGMNALLDYWEGDNDGDIRKCAYVLATAFHETATTMQPIIENLTYSSAERIRAVWPSRFKTVAEAKAYVRKSEALANKIYGGRSDLGNTKAGDGYLFRGRGFVQITGRRNYTVFGKRLGINLVAEPDLALTLEYATRIIFDGMEDGVFTGKKLSAYFSETVEDPVNARRIVNGTDKAGLIEDYYYAFLGALKAATAATPPPDISPEESAPDKPNLAKDATTIGAVIASGGAAATFLGDMIGKIDNPWALGALVAVAAGLVVVFWGRFNLADKKGA